jgi:DNA replication protein DnaC
MEYKNITELTEEEKKEIGDEIEFAADKCPHCGRYKIVFFKTRLGWYTAQHACAAMMTAEERKQRYKFAGIPERYLDAKSEQTQAILDKLRDNKNVFIYGAAGSGKTYTACAVAKKVIDKGQGVIFVNIVDLFQKIYSLQNTVNGELEYERQKLLETDLLILDDIAAEKPSDYTMSFLYGIINHRYNNRKPTVLTSNLSFAELVKGGYDERIIRRIKENVAVVKLDFDYKRGGK